MVANYCKACHTNVSFFETQYGSTDESSAITKGCIVVAGSHDSLASPNQEQYPEATGIDLT